MRSATMDERVRDYIEAERVQVPVPPVVAARILHALDASRPAPRRPRLAFARVAVATAALLLLGLGVALTRAVQMPAAIERGTWSSVSSMAVPRAYQTATLLPNGKVLVVGGRGLLTISAPWQRAGSAVSSAELYDPKTRRWSSAGTLSAPRFGHTATLLANGKVLVVGGNSILPNGTYPVGVDSLSSAELYDPQTNSWSLAASMRTARTSHTATLLADGRVLVAGGIESSRADPGSVLASAELYDPAANTWTAATPMPSARWNQSATLLSDHRVLVIGGIDRMWDLGMDFVSTGLNTAEFFDPATDSWSPAPSTRYARISPSSTLLPDGRVLVVGDNGVNAQTAEIYDPAAEQWSAGPKPAAGRAGHVAALLHSGAVLIAGGLVDNSAELFDWRRNIWASAGSLAVTRSGATATVLANGQVLVAGGFGRGSTAWAGAELYDPQGSQAVGITKTSSTYLLAAGVAPLLAIVAVLLVLGLWLQGRRRARQSQAGVIWID
jgi:N-acetylneuraminic acid mutarotase